MKKEELLEIGLTEEQIKSVQALSGKDVQAEKDKTAKAIEERDSYKQQVEDMSAEVETLKTSNASAEDWQKKFEDLDAKVKADEEARITEQKRLEKEALNKQRWANASVDKDGKPLNWYNEFTENGYYAKFCEEIEKPENQGKADKDVLYGLYKDDGSAIKSTVQTINLAGGKPMGSETDDSQARAIMGLPNK